MAYTDIAQVKLRARGTLSPSDDPAAYDAVITEGIDWGEAKIDARLLGRYPVPFTTTIPKLVKHVCADYAGYYAITEAFSAGGENKANSFAEELKQRADECLEDIAEGKALLDLGETASPDPGIYSNTSSQPGILTKFDLVNRPSISGLTDPQAVPLTPYRRR